MGKHGLHAVSSNAWEKNHELPITGVRTQKQMDQLIRWFVILNNSKIIYYNSLQIEKEPMRRVQHLVFEMKKVFKFYYFKNFS